MNRTLSALWRGTLSPYAHCGEDHAEIRHLLHLMETNRGVLFRTFNDNQQALFDKYDDCSKDYISLLTEQAFCDGFSLASQLLSEAFQKDMT